MSIAADVARPSRSLVSGILRRTVAGLVVGCLAVTGALGSAPMATVLMPVADPFDPEVVLPPRVDEALHRTFDAVERSVAAVDDRHKRDARRALRAAKVGFDRSHRAVMHQVTAVVDPETEEESTAGPDSAQAALNVAQASVGMLSSLFDRLHRRGLVRRIEMALTRAQNHRKQLLTTIKGMNEEAGAAYVDLLADTAPQYTDEVAGIQEAIADDRLTRASRRALKKALVRSKRAESIVLKLAGPAD
jgi:hypothetical protein